MEYLLGYLIGYAFLFAVILGVGALYKRLGFSSELARKLIHILICFTWLVLYKFFANSWQILVMPISFVVINALSVKYKFFAGMEREGEKSSLGTVYYAVSITILMALSLIFKETLIPTGVAVFALSFGDGAAAIAGHYLGKNSPRITKTKTLVGSLFCFIFTVIGIYILSIFVPVGLTLGEVILIGLSTTALELVGHGLDNFSITLGVTVLATLLREVV
jgi:phytol kinase